MTSRLRLSDVTVSCFSDYAHLADHFREDHFFCEQGKCKDEKFVVFRTDIDLQGKSAVERSCYSLIGLNSGP